MGWEGSDRRSRLPPGWGSLRRQVLARAGGRCEWVDPVTGVRCCAPATDADHRLAKTDDHRLEALQALCGRHHSRKSSVEGALAWRKKRRTIIRRFNADRVEPPIRPSGPVRQPWETHSR